MGFRIVPWSRLGSTERGSPEGLARKVHCYVPGACRDVNIQRVARIPRAGTPYSVMQVFAPAPGFSLTARFHFLLGTK